MHLRSHIGSSKGSAGTGRVVPVGLGAMNTALEHLLNHLEVNKDSPSISLAYASIGDDGCVEIARFLRDNIFVKTLDLRGNNVQGKGATALAGGIKLNRSLRSLNLKWNAIGSSLRDTSADTFCKIHFTCNLHVC